ncbi:MAG: undecaprenyl-diphosphate phosphatase [Rhodospirillales bacterium]|nr:undecaprenyl-diphosphate phosphatase [Rhodospirillales bacterium]
MPLLHIVVLALVQGITEFLPISSSGHLILVPALNGWADQGIVIDVAVHVGTLCAVAVYFWRDVAAMLNGLIRLVTNRPDADSRLVLMVVVATIPVVVAGFILKTVFPEGIRSVIVIGWTTLLFGLVLYACDRWGGIGRRIADLGMPDAMVIGLAQMIALIPGTSRSGITMSAARALGFERVDAARFSLLLSMPTILGAGLLLGVDLFEDGNSGLTSDALLAGGLAFLAALAAIALMMRWLRHATFTPFVVYRVFLGIALLVYAYGGFGPS